MKMIPSDNLSTADKKHLNHRIPVITRQCNDIFVFSVRIGNFLFLGNLADTV